MADSAAPTTQESTASVLAALTSYLPGFMNVMNSQVLPQNQAQLNAAQKISDPYAQLQTDLYNKFAPQLAKTGTEVENINRTGAAKTDLQIMQNQGGDLVKSATELDKQLNPEYYQTKSLESGKLAELLGSINLNDAMPEAERAINQENIRSGNISTPSATNTVANAMSFGNAKMNRMGALSQAIGQATNFLQPAQSQFNPVVTALNRPSSNTGSNQFQGVTQPSDQAYQTSNNILGNISSMRQQENDINANRRDVIDRINEGFSAV